MALNNTAFFRPSLEIDQGIVEVADIMEILLVTLWIIAAYIQIFGRVSEESGLVIPAQGANK